MNENIVNTIGACSKFIYNTPHIIIMSEPAVLDWDRIVHKNVRSSDGQDAGNVDAINGDSIVIITEGARKEYKISKSDVKAYNGAEVFLKLTIEELEKYRV